MRASVRNCLLAASLSLAHGAALAGTSGLYLPAPPTGPGGEDSIETSSGTRCRQSINSNGSYLDVGVTGSAGTPVDRTLGGLGFFGNDTRDQEATAYARVTIPLGAKPKRIDCSHIYELELTKLRREVELLRLGAR
ncbi:hypothetical protein ABC347_08625 [Sphingomonas sp. 1P06PA]|uniref:hypothetical protein n=1 Tax=Sphingomonas sp. 1P06PA TaxID=554121 RepID=UPI0039A781C0